MLESAKTLFIFKLTKSYNILVGTLLISINKSETPGVLLINVYPVLRSSFSRPVFSRVKKKIFRKTFLAKDTVSVQCITSKKTVFWFGLTRFNYLLAQKLIKKPIPLKLKEVLYLP